MGKGGTLYDGTQGRRYLNLWIICNFKYFCGTSLTQYHSQPWTEPSPFSCGSLIVTLVMCHIILPVIIIKLMTLLIRFLVTQNKEEISFTLILNVQCNVLTLLEPAAFLNSSNTKKWAKTLVSLLNNKSNKKAELLGIHNHKTFMHKIKSKILT